jgi:predicted  nucleic acid-binding Zn-ribbon protein
MKPTNATGLIPLPNAEGRKMNLTSLLEKIARRQEERRVTQWSDYRKLVAEVCDGKEPDADRLANVLADNDRTLENLRHDVQLLTKRRKLREQMLAIDPLAGEAKKVEKAIADGEQELERITERHKEKMSPIYARRFEISQIRKLADQARDDLRATCEDRELVAEYEELQPKIDGLRRQCGEIEREIHQREVWRDGDLREGGISPFDSEKSRYSERAREHQQRIDDLERGLSPLRQELEALDSQMEELELQFLIP